MATYDTSSHYEIQVRKPYEEWKHQWYYELYERPTALVKFILTYQDQDAGTEVRLVRVLSNDARTPIEVVQYKQKGKR